MPELAGQPEAGDVVPRGVQRVAHPKGPAAHEVGLLGLGASHGDVGFLAAQIGVGGCDHQRQLDVGPAVAEPRQASDDHFGEEGVDGADPYRTRRGPGEALEPDPHPRQPIRHRPALLDHDLPRRRQAVPVRGLVEELEREIGFEAGHPARDGHVVDPQLSRRGGQGPRPGQGHGVGEVAPVHGRACGQACALLHT